MNPVLILCRNCLDLTKRCVQSIQHQDIETSLYVVDNGSSDGTTEWLRSVSPSGFMRFSQNEGVSKGWNLALEVIFTASNAEHCLVLNNDTILPHWFYSALLSYEVPFVTGVSVNSMDAIKEPPPRVPLVGHPDFSAFLIRKEAWQKIGPFDEGMKFYAQDCDYHLRACQAGVPLLAANLPFYHERSSTLNLAPPKEQEEIQVQANADRAYFQKKWGWPVGSEEYQRATSTKWQEPRLSFQPK